ncbi:metallophosphoesterase family protein [Roseibium algae]|uniref:Metallophosphoesterase family protein n=1 Tax=Roseibium algae TaxID=3123038 RepID=A0ABU8TNE7_9HYPH
MPEIFGAAVPTPGMPKTCVPWPFDIETSGAADANQADDILQNLTATAGYGRWKWPKRPIVFVSDLHADAEGFLRSLASAGVIQRAEDFSNNFKLTRFGTSCTIIIGGDCLDKGPSNLDLLDAIKALRDTSARVKLLAGNHDLRLLLGVRALLGPRTPLSEHMFIRMGKKVLPLLREVYDRYVDPKADLDNAPDLKACRELIFPSQDWTTTFPEAAATHLSSSAIAKEVNRLTKKIITFEDASLAAGMDLQMLYCAALKCRDLFLRPDGQYAWFYGKMKAVHKSGSLLFVHAGMDDQMSSEISNKGPGRLNKLFREQARHDPFTFYSGNVANMMRTKYRSVDKKLTRSGVEDLHQAGIKIVIQGHINRHKGQRLKTIKGLLHLEADVTLDRNSRQLEGLDGIGSGATLIFPDGEIVGISRDFPHAKVFTPRLHLKQPRRPRNIHLEERGQLT